MVCSVGNLILAGTQVNFHLEVLLNGSMAFYTISQFCSNHGNKQRKCLHNIIDRDDKMVFWLSGNTLYVLNKPAGKMFCKPP